MTIEYKTSPLRGIELKASGSGWEISGYGSTWGDPPDAANDVVQKGAFSRSLQTIPSKFLLNHAEVIGMPIELREDSKGLFGRWSILDTTSGRDAHVLAKAKALDALSIGFIPKQTRKRSDGVRVLEDVDLLEVSLCPWGMNPNALVTAVKSRGGDMSMSGELAMRRSRLSGVIPFDAKRLTLGGQVATSPELKALKDRGAGTARVVLSGVTLKALTNPPGSVADNRPDLAGSGTVIPSVLDFLPQIETSAGSVQVPRSSHPTGANAVAAGALKPEITVSYAGAPVPMCWVAGFVTATRNVLDDATGLEQLIDSDLRDAVREDAELQVLQGDGAGSNMRGVWSTVGVLTLAATGGQELNALLDAIGDVVSASRRMPTVIAVSMGSYPVILKAIAATGAVNGAPNLLGVPLVPTAGLTDGRALVGCGPCAPVFVQRGLTVETGFIADQLLRNMLSIRGEMSGVVAVSKPQAWCAVSGLGVS